MKRYLLYLCVILCVGYATAAASNSEFVELLQTTRWVAYAPTHFDPMREQYPSPDSIAEDLSVLLSAGFNGVITYGSQSTLAEIPAIAKRLGFKGVIMGVWDFTSDEEMANAVLARDYVDGYCVGNEGLYRRYELQEIKDAIARIKQLTNRPATTTEEVPDYDKDYVVELGDWVFPNVHPFISQVKTPTAAVTWVRQYYRLAKRKADRLGKPVLFKEVGYPTAGQRPASSRNQRQFFELMEKTDVNFAYFEAFDQYWKRHMPVEPHWGLFNKNRRPKKFASDRIKVNDARH